MRGGQVRRPLVAQLLPPFLSSLTATQPNLSVRAQGGGERRASSASAGAHSAAVVVAGRCVAGLRQSALGAVRVAAESAPGRPEHRRAEGPLLAEGDGRGRLAGAGEQDLGALLPPGQGTALPFLPPCISSHLI